MQGYGLGTQLGILLPYSRTQESEADHIGLILMAKAEYDPALAQEFWRRMTAKDKSARLPEFMSTHPTDASRLKKLQEFLPEARRYYVAARRPQARPPGPPGATPPPPAPAAPPATPPAAPVAPAAPGLANGFLPPAKPRPRPIPGHFCPGPVYLLSGHDLGVGPAPGWTAIAFATNSCHLLALIPSCGRSAILVAAGFSLRPHRRDARATGLIATRY